MSNEELRRIWSEIEDVINQSLSEDSKTKEDSINKLRDLLKYGDTIKFFLAHALKDLFVKKGCKKAGGEARKLFEELFKEGSYMFVQKDLKEIDKILKRK